MDILLLGIIPFGLLHCLLSMCNPELHCVLCTGALQGVVGGLRASLSKNNFARTTPMRLRLLLSSQKLLKANSYLGILKYS